MKMFKVLCLAVLFVTLAGCGFNPYSPDPSLTTNDIEATNAVVTPDGRPLSPEERSTMFPPGTISVKLCKDAPVYNRMEENPDYYVYTIPATAEFMAYGISEQWVTVSDPPRYIKRSALCL